MIDRDDNGRESVSLSGSGTDPDGTIASYVWSAGGTSYSGANVIVSLPVGGHTVTLTVTDDDGATDTDTVRITIDSPANVSPTANAGSDRTVTDRDRDDSEPVSLSGSGTDPDGTIVSYVWTAGGTSYSGANVTISLPVGVHTVTLTVTDNDGATGTDTVEITVETPLSSDLRSAFSGHGFSPQTFTQGQPNQTIRVWANIENQGAALSNRGTVDFYLSENDSVWDVDDNYHLGESPLPPIEPDESSLALGEYPFPTTIDAGLYFVGWRFRSANDENTMNNGTCLQSPQLRVIESAGNATPTADAGPDQTVPDSDGNGRESVRLDGSRSSDPDGTIDSYVWREGNRQIATTATPRVTLNEGTHTIILTVTDNEGATATDTVTITITPPGNRPPVASDQTLTTEVDTPLALTLRATDPDGDALRYSIVAGSGPENGTLSGTTPHLTYTPRSGFTGSDSFQFQVSDGQGGTDSGETRINVVGGWITWCTDFNAGRPSTTRLFGNAFVDAAGGMGNSGVLKLTTATHSQSGSFIVPSPSTNDPVQAFTISFMAYIGGGSDPPADGMSVNFAGDLPNGTFGEEGVGTGLSVCFDTFDNGGAEAPAIDIKWNRQKVASRQILAVTNGFVPVEIELTEQGQVNLTWNGQALFTNLALPGGYTPLAGRFGFGARTGGSHENHFVDDLCITVLPPNRPPVVKAGPDRVVEAQSLPVVFRLAGTVQDDQGPEQLAIQWQVVESRRADVSFTNGSDPRTQVSFPAYGTYTLRLTATDSQGLSHYDEVEVTIQRPAARNLAPVVEAGPAITRSPASLPYSLDLSGSVSDDDLPANGQLTVLWSKSRSIPREAEVILANPASAATRASFSDYGTYALLLTAHDGELAASDDLTVTLTRPAVQNQPPVVNVGAPILETPRDLPHEIQLLATVDDDDLPRDGQLTVRWSTERKPRGAPDVTFSNPASAVTLATFHAYGNYTLRLTANDGELEASQNLGVTLVRVNRAPIAQDDWATTTPGTSIPIDVLANDTDPDGDTLRIVSVTDPPGGTATLVRDTAIRYTPDPGRTGTDTFKYTISDGQGHTATAQVTVDVESSGQWFVRGDANADGRIDVADAVFTFSHLFLGTAPPPCDDAADTDDDGILNIADGIYGLEYLFMGGPLPPAPSPSSAYYVPDDCGPDPTDDNLTCNAFPPCAEIVDPVQPPSDERFGLSIHLEPVDTSRPDAAQYRATVRLTVADDVSEQDGVQAWSLALRAATPACQIVNAYAPRRNWWPGEGRFTDLDFEYTGIYTDPGLAQAQPIRAEQLTGHDLGEALPAGLIEPVGETGIAIGAGGAGIGAAADQFHYTHTAAPEITDPLGASQDFSAVVRVNSVDAPSGQSQAGIMIRETLAPDSRYAMLAHTPQDGITLQVRDVPGAPAWSVALDSDHGPDDDLWLRLACTQNRVTGLYVSASETQSADWMITPAFDGWAMPPGDLHLGLATSSGVQGEPVFVEYADFSVLSAHGDLRAPFSAAPRLTALPALPDYVVSAAVPSFEEPFALGPGTYDLLVMELAVDLSQIGTEDTPLVEPFDGLLSPDGDQPIANLLVSGGEGIVPDMVGGGFIVTPVPGNGTIRGQKWYDLDQDRIKDNGEPGLGGWQIYIDEVSNNQYDAGQERMVVTDNDGRFEFTNLPDSDPHTSYVVRENLIPGWIQKYPDAQSGYEHKVVIKDGKPDVDEIGFGNYTKATYDFGDAPRPYPTLEANGGAHILVSPDCGLGATDPDAELDGQPFAQAAGDDRETDSWWHDDEDGVDFVDDPLIRGTQAMIMVTPRAELGFLNAWIDFNLDGDWADPGELIIANARIGGSNPPYAGRQRYTFSVPPEPASLDGSTYARFIFSATDTPPKCHRYTADPHTHRSDPRPR